MLDIGVIQFLEETSLAETELERAELAGKEVDDGGDIGGWDEDAVDAVDDAVGGEDVDGDEARVEVYGWAFEGHADGEALCVAEVLGGRVECGDGVAVENAAGGVGLVDDVVEEDVFEDFFGWVAAVLGDLFEGGVGGGEDGVVCLCAVEELDEVVVFVDELGEFGGVFALADELSIMLKVFDDVVGMGFLPRRRSYLASHRHGEGGEVHRGVADDEDGHGLRRTLRQHRRMMSPRAMTACRIQHRGPCCKRSLLHPSPYQKHLQPCRERHRRRSEPCRQMTSRAFRFGCSRTPLGLE